MNLFHYSTVYMAIDPAVHCLKVWPLREGRGGCTTMLEWQDGGGRWYDSQPDSHCESPNAGPYVSPL